MIVTNLFSFRATDPRDLKEMVRNDYARAVGVNDGPLIKAAASAKLVVAAWGNNGYLAGRADDVMTRVLPDVKLFCIGLSNRGYPLHPCMVPYTDRPNQFYPPCRQVQPDAQSDGR